MIARLRTIGLQSILAKPKRGVFFSSSSRKMDDDTGIFSFVYLLRMSFEEVLNDWSEKSLAYNRGYGRLTAPKVGDFEDCHLFVRAAIS